jgi:acetyl-CoA carboxylase biotin carboxyl carrier protein
VPPRSRLHPGLPSLLDNLMIDIRKLKELVRLMVENDLSELDLKDQEETVTIKRGGAPMIMPQGGMPFIPARIGPGGAADEGTPEGGAAEPAPADTSGLVAIESPMVGTFYTAPNPDSPPFVTVGSAVATDTVVCLIEAMKVFNEIKAEVNGTIERVLVNNGEAVEFGQKLFLVRPS